MSKMLAYRAVPSLFVVAHGKDNPSDEEWEAYLKFYREEANSPMKILVVSDGGGPNTGQRAAMNEQLVGKPTVGICTDSRVVRGIVTAVSWFNSQVRAFRKTDLEAALNYLGLTPAEITEALQAVEEALNELEGSELEQE